MTMHVELQAACSALGYQEGKQYVKEPDCLESVKDLIRFLKREDDTCDIRRQLGHAQIVQNDLIPILVHYTGDNTLWETVVRLLVNLTQPAFLCFKSHIPEEKTLRNNYLDLESHLQTMKEAFINEDVFAAITGKLGELLKLDWEHRHEEHRLLIERLLILIRNVLHIPPNPDAEQRTDDDASVHDQVLWSMHVSGLEDILLYIACSEEERNLSMHILEIVSLMFREQSPEMLASAGGQRSMTEKEKDERELEMVREQEKLQKKANIMKHSTRHSRFGGTFVVKNFKSISENDLIYHKSKCDVDNINLDANKRPKKKAKNRKPLIDREVKRRSTLSIRLGLKEFCVQFLENCYNPLMYAVKDVLNREKSQEHDETYYLWAMRFFMEFCRLHSGKVDLVSETMSVQAFHYIQVQLFSYYEMQMMEKKEAIVWGKRTHLALKAYQELLLTLDSMDRSGNPVLMESSKVLKSNIFYMMEFRDVFLTLLRHFDQSRQSRAYLTDLIETTHLFLKMLEHFSKKTGHLVVQKKKRGGKKKSKPARKATVSPIEPSQQELEDLWDEISSDLSAIFQGRAEVPEGVTPFDAVSEVDVDQQRVDAMIRIQDAMRGRQPGEAVALFRAAREVWPERNEFGSADISPEDEFMALREIFMTQLPRPTPEIPGLPEEDVDEEIEEEETVTVQTSEQEFVFREFAVKFAKPEILKNYVLLLADFQTNSTHANHCCVKMLHRVAVDLGYVGMVFQASLFRVFQRILNSPLATAERYKEIAKFATYVVRKFVEVAENNKKAFMELLFWKTNKEAIEMVEGYGSYQSKGKQAWTEDAELEVRRLFEEYRDNSADDKDTVDCIMERITDPSKTRGQIIRELKRQELIESAKELKKPKGSSRAGPWREEDELELRELYEKHREADDPVGGILSEMCKRRSRPKIMEKLLAMGLVGDRKELYKKRAGKSGARSRRKGRNSDDSGDDELQELPSDYEDEVEDRPPSIGTGGGGSGISEGASSSVSSVSSDDSDAPGGGGAADDADDGTSAAGANMSDIIRGLVAKGYKDQILWIQRGLTRTAGDREEEDEDVGVPLVPLTEENETAMEDEVFLDFLKRLGIAPPANEQEAFWRIPAGITPAELRNMADGLVLDENGEPVNASKIKMKAPSAPQKKDGKEKSKEKREKREERRKEREEMKRQKEERKKKVNEKFAMLKEFVKNKKETKKNRRSKKQVESSSSDDEDAGNRGNLSTKAGNQSKKSRLRNMATSGSDSDAVPLRRQKKDNSSNDKDSSHETQSPAPSSLPKMSGSSSQKKRRLKKIVDSSDSDDDVPLRSLTSQQGHMPSSSVVTLNRSDLLEEDDSNSNDVRHTEAGDQSQETESHTSIRKAETGDQSQETESHPFAWQKVTGNQSQETESHPLLFLSSSDEGSDIEDTKQTENRPASSNSKRSRSSRSGSDSDGSKVTQSKKKMRLESSGSDSESKPEESFPATLYTQGPESDSDLDDHVPLRKAIKKRNVIDSDDD